MTLHEMQRRLNDIDIEQEIVNAVKVTEREIVRFVKVQIAFGTTGENKKIRNVFTKRTYYSLRWEKFRRALGLQVDFFDLKVTGEFTSKIEVFSITPQSFVIDSRDVKTPELERMFGEEIMNMTPENRDEWLTYHFNPELEYRIKSKIGT